MDQFYLSVYENLVYQWLILNANHYDEKGIHFYIDQNDSKRLVFKYLDLTGEIYFWSMHNIIEETIVNEQGKIVFYLHFRIINLLNTRKFIYDFFKQLIKDKKPKHIGMSCSCGITTSVFSEKLQKLSDMMDLPYQFDVVALNAIELECKNYDMIILAPQTAYLEPKIKEICKNDCYVMSIDASVFATSHYQEALTIIQTKLKS